MSVVMHSHLNGCINFSAKTAWDLFFSHGSLQKDLDLVLWQHECWHQHFICKISSVLVSYKMWVHTHELCLFKNLNCYPQFWLMPMAYLGPFQTTWRSFFAKILDSLWPLTIFTKILHHRSRTGFWTWLRPLLTNVLNTNWNWLFWVQCIKFKFELN